MSYMGLFWETGMPEAWALSRKSQEGLGTGGAQQPWTWPQVPMELGTLLDPADLTPGDAAGQPAPKPDGGKTKS